MENNNLTQKNVEYIDPEAIVGLEFSAGYYSRIVALTQFLIKNKPQEELVKAYEQIRDNKYSDEWVMHYETMLILCKEFESKAKEQNFIKEMSMEEFVKINEAHETGQPTN